MSPPTVAPARPEIVSHGLRRRRAAWIERATDADHKSVALLFIGGSLSFLVVAALEFALMRIQLIVPENTVINPETFDRIMSVFGVTALVLFAIPLALGLIGYIVPFGTPEVVRHANAFTLGAQATHPGAKVRLSLVHVSRTFAPGGVACAPSANALA